MCCWLEVGGATADEGGRGPTSSGLECQMDTPGTLLSCSSACARVAEVDITRSNSNYSQCWQSEQQSEQNVSQCWQSEQNGGRRIGRQGV